MKINYDFFFRCGVCGRGFDTEEQLDNHIVNHNNQKRHECTTCGKFFVTLPQLEVTNMQWELLQIDLYLHFISLSLISESTQENARFNATPVELHFLSVRTSTVIIVPFTCKKNVSNATNVTR